jgi:tRNA threonylcarbamoyladenosine biosynthesis protein TsaE
VKVFLKNMLLSHTIKTFSELETVNTGKIIGRKLKPRDVVLLHGDLGSGKTRLAKGIVSEAVGIDQDEVVSPSYTIVNSYRGEFEVHHADLYRLQPEQVGELGLDDLLDCGGALVIEWGEKVQDIFSDALNVSINYCEGEESREITLCIVKDSSLEERLTDLVGGGRCS